MRRVHILDGEPRGWFEAVPPFWYPVYMNRRPFRGLGVEFRWFAEPGPGLADCDAVFVSSRHYHIEGLAGGARDSVFEALSALRGANRTVVWFDMRDSGGNTQFEVLPHVDRYLKKQLFRDRSLYRAELYGNRAYTDYFHREFGVVDDTREFRAPPPADQEYKLGVSWNLGLLDRRLSGRAGKALGRAADRARSIRGLAPRLGHTPWNAPRTNGLLALFTTEYRRNTVAFQRRRGLEILAAMDDPRVTAGERVPRGRYNRLIRNSRAVLSLFGWGELCHRDSEAFLAGAALMMPDVSHLETYPDLYLPRRTYFPLPWNLDGLPEAFNRLEDEAELRLSLAREGQERFLACWNDENREAFCRRAIEWIDKPQPRTLSEPAGARAAG